MSYIKLDGFGIMCPYNQDGWEDGNICGVQPKEVSCEECIRNYIADLEDNVKNTKEPDHQDITSEQAIAAYNVMRKYASEKGYTKCNTCVFTDICISIFKVCPAYWTELEEDKWKNQK